MQHRLVLPLKETREIETNGASDFPFPFRRFSSSVSFYWNWISFRVIDGSLIYMANSLERELYASRYCFPHENNAFPSTLNYCLFFVGSFRVSLVIERGGP